MREHAASDKPVAAAISASVNASSFGAGGACDRAQWQVVEFRHNLTKEPAAIAAGTLGMLALPLTAAPPLLDDRLAALIISA